MSFYLIGGRGAYNVAEMEGKLASLGVELEGAKRGVEEGEKRAVEVQGLYSSITCCMAVKLLCDYHRSDTTIDGPSCRA